MKKTLCFLTLLLTVFSVSAVAQFEGKITYTFHEVNDNGEQKKEENFTTFITSQRILVQGDKAVGMPGSMKANGLLIRLDKKDFVFLTGDTSAFSITKSGITSFMNMFGEMAKKDKQKEGGSIHESFTFKQTEETKAINGYTAHKFISKSKDGKGVIWMTQDVSINWGMLSEPWGDSMAFLKNEELPTELIFQKGWLPLKATFYKGGKVEGRMSATIEEIELAQKKVQLSPDITVKNLSEYLFQKMRQKQ